MVDNEMLRAWLKDQNLTRTAKLAGLSRSTLVRIKNDPSYNPTLMTMLALSIVAKGKK